MSKKTKDEFTIDVNVDTDGIDAATEKVRMLSDEMRAFPPQVTIQGAKNCKINIYPSQTMIIERGGTDDETE